MSVASLRPETHKAESIFGIGKKGRSKFISSVTRLNCVVEETDGGRQAVAVIGCPGLRSYATVGSEPARANFSRAGAEETYVVSGSDLYAIKPGLDPIFILSLTTTSGPVWMDENGEQLFINDGAQAFIYNYTSQTAQAVTDIDYPAGARGGTCLNGRFLVYVTKGPNAGRVYASDSYNGLAWNGLNFITPESRPTGIIAIYRWFDDLVILGNKAVEWWSFTSVAVTGALGLQPSANANTVVGGVGERGVGSIGQHIFFVGHEGGPIGVYEIVGYSIEKVSTGEMDVKLSYAGGIHAVCTGYMMTDHALFQVTIPSNSEETAATFIYDVTTGQWSDRISHNRPYYRGLLASEQRGQVFITDAFSASLYVMDEQEFKEGGDLLIFEVSSQLLLKEGDFLTLQKIQVDMETGVGNDMNPGHDPHGILYVSKDGGRTWPIQRHVSLGKVGEYRHRAQEYRFGSARSFAVRLRITDPVQRRVTGAYLVAEPGTA